MRNLQLKLLTNKLHSGKILIIFTIFICLVFLEYSTPNDYVFGYFYSGSIVLVNYWFGGIATTSATVLAVCLTIFNIWIPGDESIHVFTIANRVITAIALIFTGFLSQRLRITQQAVALTQTQLENQAQLMRLREDFASTLTHDFNTAPLAEPDKVRIFASLEQAETFEKMGFSELTKDSPSYTYQEVQKLLLKACPQDLETANARYEAIKPYLEPNAPAITKASRSIRRWRKQYQSAQKLYGDMHGYVGLLPKHLEKGHHKKLEPALLDLMTDFIEKHYFTAKNRRVSGLYREFQVVCSQQQIPLKPPSSKTFREQIKRQKNYQLTLARQGSKIAKQTKPFYSTEGMPQNGELPWENAHIDHTCLDINLVSSLISLATCNIGGAISNEQINLGRCWATLMVDGYSKRILAVYLSFEPPSYRSCLMVIRICVKRFQRLPQTIITDNGKEFHSVYFQQLLAYYKCNHKYLPSGEPRYGSPVERLFGTTNTLWLHELQGNTQILKNNRQVTKSVNPVHQAVWTLG